MPNLYCLICNDNVDKTLTCQHCSYISCISCIKKMKKIICCNCNIIYNDNIVKPFIKYLDMHKLYVKFYVENKIKNYTNFTIRKCILMAENKNLLRFGYQKIESDFEYIFKCNYNNCKGIVNLNYYCNDCKSVYCKKCEEIINESHVCDENIIKNIDSLNENCKKCINCFTYLEKVDGCNDMRCLNCGIYFNWRNLKIDYKGNTNKIEDKNIINIEYQNNLVVNLSIFNSIRVLNLKNPTCVLYKEILNKYIKLIKVIKVEEGEYFIAKNKNKLNEKNIEKLYFLYKKELYYKLILNFYIENAEINNEERYISIPVQNVITFLNNLHKNYIFPENFLYKFTLNKFTTINNNNTSKRVDTKIHLIINDVNKNKKKDFTLPFGIKKDILILKKILTYRMYIKISTDYKNKIYDSLYIIQRLSIENVILIIPNNYIEMFWRLHFKKCDLCDRIKIIYITNKNMFTEKDKNTFIKTTFEYIKNKPYLLIIDELHLYKNKCYKIFSKLIHMTIDNRFDNNRYLLSFSSIQPINSMFYNIILINENKFLTKLETFNILLEMITYLTKAEIIDLTKKVYYGKKYDDKSILPYPYLCKDLIFKKTKEDQVLCLYNQNNWSQINIFNYTRPKFINKKMKFENFSHNLCKKEKLVCKFCSICNPKYINEDLESCCYIHIKPNMNLKLTHQLYYDENLPITKSISLLSNKIVKQNIYVDNITKILINYGFSLYEINLLMNTLVSKKTEFNNEYNNFIIHKTFSLETCHPIQLFTKQYMLSKNEIECMKSAFTNFDYINKTYISNCDVVSTKGYMQMETMYIKHIYKDITEIYNKYYNIKIIVGLYFNSSILDLQKLLEENNYNYLIIKKSVTNKDLIIKKFKTEKHILILNILSLNTITEYIDDRIGNEPRYVLLPFIYDIINTSIFLKKIYTEHSESYPVIHILNNYMNKNISKIKEYNFNCTEWKTNDLWNCFI